MSGVRQNETEIKPFAWSKGSTRAAMLCAEDLLTDIEIADNIGISRATLSRWKQHPEFKAEVDSLVAELQVRARAEGLGRFDKRKRAAEDRHRRMTALIIARAGDMADEVPGGETGLLVRQLKSVKVSYDADPNDPDSKPFNGREEIFEYAFDAALMRELRELEKQVSQDAGQWSEKREISGPDGGPIPITTLEVVIDPDLVD